MFLLIMSLIMFLGFVLMILFMKSGKCLYAFLNDVWSFFLVLLMFCLMV